MYYILHVVAIGDPPNVIIVSHPLITRQVINQN